MQVFFEDGFYPFHNNDKELILITPGEYPLLSHTIDIWKYSFTIPLISQSFKIMFSLRSILTSLSKFKIFNKIGIVTII